MFVDAMEVLKCIDGGQMTLMAFVVFVPAWRTRFITVTHYQDDPHMQVPLLMYAQLKMSKKDKIIFYVGNTQVIEVDKTCFTLNQ